jgi:hypothetical protein
MLGCGSSAGSGDGGALAIDGGEGQDAGVVASDAAPDAEPADLTAPIEVSDEQPDGAPDGPGFSLTLDRTRIDFGGVFDSGCMQPVVTVQAHNAGPGASPTLTTVVSEEFTLTNDGCGGRSLGPDERCEIGVSPRPGPAGEHVGSLMLWWQGGTGSVGVVLTAQVFPYDSETITPNSVDFGRVAPGASSAPTTFAIKNTGGQAFNHLAASISTDQFVITRDDCTAQVVPAAGSCSVDVVFRPQSMGAKTALLMVEAMGCARGTAIAQVTGTGGP